MWLKLKPYTVSIFTNLNITTFFLSEIFSTKYRGRGKPWRQNCDGIALHAPVGKYFLSSYVLWQYQVRVIIWISWNVSKWKGWPKGMNYEQYVAFVILYRILPKFTPMISLWVSMPWTQTTDSFSLKSSSDFLMLYTILKHFISWFWIKMWAHQFYKQWYELMVKRVLRRKRHL